MELNKNHNGFTLIETVVSLAIFVIIALGIYFSYANVLNVVVGSQLNLTTLSIMDAEIENIRNMAYSDIGIVGGWPRGLLQADKTVVMGDAPFSVHTTVRNIDDPFDSTAGGNPNDTAPADYKLVELEVSCTNCVQIIPAKTTAMIAPPSLESASNNGSLFINVFDASGQPISGANIHITNNLVSPPITIDDTSSVNGVLQLVDIPTSNFGYSISISKPGYSSARTYQSGLPANPNPITPHATVAKQQVTTVSFAIDHLSSLHFNTTDMMCQPVGNVDFYISGAKLIGTDPSVYKYTNTLATDANGSYINSVLEWDTYTMQNQDTTYTVSGISGWPPLVVNPNTNNYLTWLMEPISARGLLIAVKNQAGQSINDAKVTLSKTGFSQSLYSGQKTTQHTDWSADHFAEKSSYLAVDDPTGSLVLGKINGKYATASWEWLTGPTIDFGVSNTVFYNLDWSPLAQPQQAGEESLRIQIATNNDNATWNFVGPDGTANSYYSVSNTLINQTHNGNRYLRYKVFLRTENDQFTPRLDDITFHFRSSCIPDGQVFFNGLVSDTYTVKIEKDGYQIFTDNAVSVSKTWQNYQATIAP